MGYMMVIQAQHINCGQSGIIRDHPGGYNSSQSVLREIILQVPAGLFLVYCIFFQIFGIANKYVLVCVIVEDIYTH